MPLITIWVCFATLELKNHKNIFHFQVDGRTDFGDRTLIQTFRAVYTVDLVLILVEEVQTIVDLWLLLKEEFLNVEEVTVLVIDTALLD